LQQVLHRVTAVEVPEPSPLFWEHFGARVREAVARQPQPAGTGWPTLTTWQLWTWPRWAVGTATLLTCVALVWAGWHDYRGRYIDKSGSVRLINEGAPDTSDLNQAAMPDEDWNLVVSMAEDVTVDDADEPGLAVPSDASDHAMTDLSSEQRSELARLLTVELTRPAS
jgi:hypothetical protein